MSATVITREDKAGAIPDVTSEAAEGRITDEALAAARAMIGMKLRPKQDPSRRLGRYDHQFLERDR